MTKIEYVTLHEYPEDGRVFVVVNTQGEGRNHASHYFYDNDSWYDFVREFDGRREATYWKCKVGEHTDLNYMEFHVEAYRAFEENKGGVVM